MALFKPEETKTNSFNGICECTIVDIQDKSAQFDWADIYLQVTLLQNGSKYTTEWDGEKAGTDGKYLAYFYKQAPKKPGKQAYNVAHYRMYPNGGNCKEQLQKDIDWMKSRGYIKEDTGEAQPIQQVDADDLGSLALDNL